jgi:signal transduction histidine kinase
MIGDRQRFIQVFVNLLTNACHASHPGDRVVIDARRHTRGIVIEVRDNGIGIPDEVRDRIFEPFFTTRDPGEGTGLGLPLVYTIVKEHGGSIRVDSTPGKGTRVRISLPLSRASPGDGTATDTVLQESAL